MITVDVNVIMYFWLETSQSPLAKQVRRIDSDWIVPSLWRSEFRNVLATYLHRGLLSYSEAWWFGQKAEADLREYEHPGETADVLKLAQQAHHSPYDCEYVALANSLGVKLVTGDRAVARKFPRTAVLMKDYVA